MIFRLQSPNKFRAAIVVVALVLFFAGAPAVAQSAQNAAPVGDARSATLGDLKDVRQEFRQEIGEVRGEIRELRETVNTMWATMVLGFVANFAAIITLAAVILQRDKQGRAQNNPRSVNRSANKFQTAVTAVFFAFVVASAVVPVGGADPEHHKPAIVAAENTG